LTYAVVGDEGEEFGEEEAVDLKEGSAGNPKDGCWLLVAGCWVFAVFMQRDGVVEAGAAPGWAGTGLLVAAAALAGEHGEKRNACAGEFRDADAEGFAEGSEVGGEFFGQRLGGGAEVEGELEVGLVGSGEEFELVWDLVRVAEPCGGWLVDLREEGFGGSPEDGGSNGALGDGEEGGVQVVSCRLLVG
jgi:hypothetical protein